jgi:hypothetical protein
VTPQARPIPEPIGRRLALTPIGLDVVAALAHVPGGLRLTPLAGAIGSPVSSVQAALRILLANGLVVRDDNVPPDYALADHPAREPLIDLALVLPEAIHVLGLVLRASPAVSVATVDRDGFVVGLDPDAPAGARERLTTSLDAIARARSNAPPVQVSDLAELRRMTTVSVGLRARLTSAVALKGQAEFSLGRGRAPSGSAIVNTRSR